MFNLEKRRTKSNLAAAMGMLQQTSNPIHKGTSKPALGSSQNTE